MLQIEKRLRPDPDLRFVGWLRLKEGHAREAKEQSDVRKSLRRKDQHATNDLGCEKQILDAPTSLKGSKWPALCNYIPLHVEEFSLHISPHRTICTSEQQYTEIKVTKPRSVHSPQESAQESRVSGRPVTWEASPRQNFGTLVLSCAQRCHHPCGRRPRR